MSITGTEVAKAVGVGIVFSVLMFFWTMLTVPWIVYWFEEYWPSRLRVNPVEYWHWCERKQKELRARRKKKLEVV